VMYSGTKDSDVVVVSEELQRAYSAAETLRCCLVCGLLSLSLSLSANDVFTSNALLDHTF